VHSSSTKLQTTLKDPENPVTIADLTIQRTFEHILLSLYPNINFIGEEDPDTYKHLNPLVKLSDVRKDIITEEFLSRHLETRKELIAKSKLYSNSGTFITIKYINVDNVC